MAEKFIGLKKRLKLEILTLIVLTLSIIPAFLVLISIIPLCIYQWLVIKLARLCRPELTHIMTGMNAWFALENVSERAKMNLVVCLIMEGQLGDSLEEMRSKFNERVLNKRREIKNNSVIITSDNNNKSGKVGQERLVYPELRQTWEGFMGYYFWKNETNFNVKEHIRLCDFVGKEDGFRVPEVCTEADLKELSTRLLSQNWKLGFSAWEILMVPNYVGGNSSFDSETTEKASGINARTKSVAVLRFHHSMGDGKSWIKVLMGDLAQSKEAQLPDSKKAIAKRSLASRIFLPIKLPYDFIKNTLDSADKTHAWHTQEKRCKEYYSSTTSQIPVQYIKDLKNKFGVSYTAILVTVISGGIRRVMQEAGQALPRVMKSFSVLPLPGHPGSIRIHSTGINLNWHIQTEERMARLHETNMDIEQKRFSLFPLGAYYIGLVAQLFPNFIHRVLYSQGLCTIGFSPFPGPAVCPKFLDCTVIDGFLYLALGPGKLGTGVSSLVMGGKQRLVITLDKTLFPSREIFEKLGGYIEDELKALNDLSVESFQFTKCRHNNQSPV